MIDKNQNTVLQKEKLQLIIQGTYRKMRLNKKRSDTISEIVKMIEEVLTDVD